MIMAGGTDIYPALVGRFPTSTVIDITGVDELGGLAAVDDHGRQWLRIGATTTWTALAEADLPSECRALQQVARMIGAAQVQHVGTVAGNLCTASPAGDGIPVLLALQAEVELRSRRGLRRLTIDRFITGYRQTALAVDELITAVLVPLPGAGSRSAFVRCSTRSSLVISLAMVAVAVHRDPRGAIDDVAVAVGACSPVARRMRAVEQAVLAGRRGGWTADDLAGLAPIDDIRCSAAYRIAVVPTLITDALAQCGVQPDG